MRRGPDNPNWRGGKSGKGICRSCGQPTWHTSAQLCKNCYGISLQGEGNPSWGQFTSTDPQQGRDRAGRRKELGMCVDCGVKPARDRHHKDENPLNNAPENIEGLCRTCHMRRDGRLDRLIEAGKRRP